MEPLARSHGGLLALPQELLQAIVTGLPRGSKFTLRSTCKSISRSLALSCSSVIVRRSALARRPGGAKNEVLAALAAFPNARRCTVRLEAEHTSRRQSVASQSLGNNTSPQLSSLHEQELLSEALSGLHVRNITALAVSGLSCTVPAPDSECWGPLRESVLELELGDASHAVAGEQGAFNTMLHGQHFRDRSEALIKLAVSFPNLRRLSISAACFSAEGVAALACLTKLESLSLDGSLECPDGTKQAADVYRQLLRRLPELRQLRLPQAVPACGAALEESDEEAEDEHERQSQQQQQEQHLDVQDEDEEDEVIAASRQHAAASGSSSLFSSDLAMPLLHSPLRAFPLLHQPPPLSPRLPPPASPAQLPELAFPASPIPQPAALVPPALPRRAPTQRLDDLFGAGGVGGIRGSVLGAFAAPLPTVMTPALPQLPPLPALPRLSMEPPISVAEALAARASFGSSSTSKSGAGRILFFNEGPGRNDAKAADQEPFQPQPQAPSRSSGTGFHPVPANHNAAAAGSVAPSTGSISPVAPLAPAPRSQHVRSPLKPASASYAEGFVFPPHLEDLTIPLCALNRPIFEAVCAEFGQQPAGASAVTGSSASHSFANGSGSSNVGLPLGARAQPQPSISRRVLSFPYLPALGGESAARSVATAGALAAWGADTAGAAAISRPGSPVPSNSLIRTNSSLSSSLNNNSNYPGDQDPHMTATSSAVPGAGVLTGLQAAHSHHHGEADSILHAIATATGSIKSIGGNSAAGSALQQQQEAARPARRALRALHLPTLAGYSHWEGSFLRSARDFARLGSLGAELEVLHLSLELGSFRLTPENMRACLQHLSTLRGLRELRISEAQQPTCYSARKRSCSMRGAAAFGASGAPGLGSLSTASLERLGRVWPHLRSLHLFGETAVRSGGRLAVAGGWDEASLMPRACPHCSGLQA